MVSAILNNLANLTGLFFKKNHQVDLMGLLVYLINSLRKGDPAQGSVKSVVLKEIISKMSGWSTLDE